MRRKVIVTVRKKVKYFTPLCNVRLKVSQAESSSSKRSCLEPSKRIDVFCPSLEASLVHIIVLFPWLGLQKSVSRRREFRCLDLFK